MTDRPGDDAALEAEPIEVEAVADGPPAGEPAAGPEAKAAARRRRRGRLFLLLWLLPVVLVAALGYLVAAQPERVAAFLAGKPPDMATTADIQRLTDRLLKAEVESADRAQVTVHSAAITDNREAIAMVAAEAAALRDALAAFEQGFDARLEGLEARLTALGQAEPAVDPAVAAEIAGLREGLAALEARPMEEGGGGAGCGPGSGVAQTVGRGAGGASGGL